MLHCYGFASLQVYHTCAVPCILIFCILCESLWFTRDGRKWEQSYLHAHGVVPWANTKVFCGPVTIPKMLQIQSTVKTSALASQQKFAWNIYWHFSRLSLHSVLCLWEPARLLPLRFALPQLPSSALRLSHLHPDASRSHCFLCWADAAYPPLTLSG